MAYYSDPLEMPTALPAYFPAELQPQAHKVFAETRKKFPNKLYVMDAVRFVTRKMTPHFSASVKAGSVLAASALSEMGQLVDSILDRNSGTLPARERRRSEQEARASKEWTRFVAAINRANRQRQASQAAAIVGPERSHIGFTAAKEPKSDFEEFTHSDDFRSVTLHGENHTLTSRQAQMIGILYEAYKNGNPDVAVDFILEKLGTSNSRWQDTWKNNPKARQALIEVGERKGTLRLKVKPGAPPSI